MYIVNCITKILCITKIIMQCLFLYCREQADLHSIMRGLLLFLMAGYAVGIVIYDSVVFQKVNEITSTRAKWLVTFVHDLQPFRSFVKTVGRDVYKAIEIAKT